VTAGWEEQAVKLFAFMVALDRTEPDRTSTVGHPTFSVGARWGVPTRYLIERPS
jgi:hypothetical protein